MTANEAKKVARSLATFAARAKAEPANGDRSIWRINLPFYDRLNQPFKAYIYHPAGSRKIIIADGGSTISELRALGTPQLHAIQRLLLGFDVKLMEDLTVMENSNRPMSERMMSYLRARLALDGMLRIWDIMKEETANGIRSSKRYMETDEPV